MSANETILDDEAEIYDLINEVNASVNQLNVINATEEYEKKCKKIFSELDKDLTNWGKHISNYIEKLGEAQQLEEGVKHALIKRLNVNGSITEEIKTFENRLKQLDKILQENMKVSCGELVSNEELEKLKKLEGSVESIRMQLSDANEDFDEISDENKEAVKCAKVVRRAKKLLESIDGLEEELNKIQRKTVKNGGKS